MNDEILSRLSALKDRSDVGLRQRIQQLQMVLMCKAADSSEYKEALKAALELLHR
jgi:hypothetical protein